MQLIAYSEKYAHQWDQFVEHSRNGTFMQQRKFLSYHPPGKFKDCSLMAFDEQGKLTAIIPAAERVENDGILFSSYPGASHGGIIINEPFDTNQAITLVPLIIDHCRSAGYNAIEIKMVPRIYHSWPCDEIDFSLRFHGFSIRYSELATALPLKVPENINHYMEKSTKRNIVKAEKLGVEVRESDDFATYWGILEQNLAERHGCSPTHTFPEMQVLIRKFPQQIKLFSAFCEGRMIAGVLVFLLNKRVINCFYIAHNHEYQQLRPLNLIFQRMALWGMKAGFDYLDWGISTENKGTAVNRGLFKFKEGFGGRGVIREAYRLNL